MPATSVTFVYTGSASTLPGNDMEKQSSCRPFYIQAPPKVARNRLGSNLPRWRDLLYDVRTVWQHPSQLQQSSTRRLRRRPKPSRAGHLPKLQILSRFILCIVSTAHSLGITDEAVAQDEEQVYTCIQTATGVRTSPSATKCRNNPSTRMGRDGTPVVSNRTVPRTWRKNRRASETGTTNRPQKSKLLMKSGEKEHNRRRIPVPG